MGQIAESKERTRSPGGSWLSPALVLLLLVAAAAASAQTPHLVKDINQFGGPSGMFASELVAIGDTVFFVAIQPATGAELWRTNGTPEGTVLVKDIQPGPQGSRPYRLIAVGGRLFFTADDGAGRDLWKSDGTATGTILVKDFGLHGTDMYQRAALDGTLYFATAGPSGTNSTGVELWRSDGTEAGTVLVKDIVPGATSSNPSNMTVSGGVLFFTAGFPKELWKSDGTGSGTTKVADLVTDPFGEPSLFVDMDGALFFRGAAGGLWKSDGTEAGTILVWNEGVLNEGARMTDLDGALYFAAYDGTTNALWKSNGTTAGTARVKGVSVNYDDYRGRSPFAVLDGLVYFPGCEATYGCELWRSDGTEGGTFVVRDINAEANPVRVPSRLTTAGGRLFFSINDDVNGEELWKSDGTAAGTVMVKDMWGGSGGSTPTALVDADGTLFFRAQDASSSGPVWKSDGTQAGTLPVKRIHDGREPSDPRWLTDVNGTLFFSADDGSNGHELWRSDGTAAGTLKVGVQSGIHGNEPAALTNVDGTLFFTAELVGRRSLWKSDGSESGTVLVKEFSGIDGLTAVGGTLYFAAAPALYEDNPGTELWRSDGTAAGTAMVKDISLTPFSGDPRLLANVGGTLFFVANDGASGRELWKSDGTEAGTMLLKNIAPAAADSLPQDLVDIGGILFFTADDGAHGRELWKSDGTAAGTVMVKDIEPGALGSGPLHLTGFGGEAFFSAEDSTHGREIWKSDGTDAGTGLVADLIPGVGGSFPANFKAAVGTLFFTVSQNGRLWRTQGDEVNTVPVGEWSADRLGPDLGVYLYFVGGDAATGAELWRSDGTEAGTALVKDIYLGLTPSEPAFLTKSGNRLFFVATDGYVGRELWSLNALASTVDSLLVDPGETTAAVSADVVSDGGSPITERGFLYSMTNPAPQIGGADVAKVVVAGTTGPLAAALSSLSPGTPYFIRAYAMTTGGIGYDEAVFVTDALSGPFLSVNDVSVNEGAAGSVDAVFEITLSAASAQAVTVRVATSDLSAAAGQDYLAVGSTTLTFSPGQLAKTVAVPVLSDVLVEPTEAFQLTLAVPLHANLSDGRGIGTILNDDLVSRVFVSSTGSTTSDCSFRATPCRHIAGGLEQVADDGEVIVLSTGEYETAPLAITKGVKITAPIGVVAFIRQPLTIDAPGARVALRGLHMKGGGGGDAVSLVSAGALSMEETAIDRWTNGLRIGGGSASQVTILNSMFRQSGAGVRTDVGATAKVSVEGNRFEGNTTGIEAGGGSFFVRETTFVSNSAGVSAEQSVFDIQRSEFLINQTGIAALTGGVVRMSRSFVFGNDVGLSTLGGGTIQSSGTNVLRGNVTNTSGAIGTVPEQ